MIKEPGYRTTPPTELPGPLPFCVAKAISNACPSLTVDCYGVTMLNKKYWFRLCKFGRSQPKFDGAARRPLHVPGMAYAAGRTTTQLLPAEPLHSLAGLL